MAGTVAQLSEAAAPVPARNSRGDEAGHLAFAKRSAEHDDCGDPDDRVFRGVSLAGGYRLPAPDCARAENVQAALDGKGSYGEAVVHHPHLFGLRAQSKGKPREPRG